MLLEVFSELLEMLVHSEDSSVPRHIYTPSLERGLITKARVTVIEDAAHVMTPFAGQGTDHAMLDALELADFITSKPNETL